ncbi:MAG: hypothetical protein AAF479_07260, partial [Pseudomonadota bacterium]
IKPLVPRGFSEPRSHFQPRPKIQEAPAAPRLRSIDGGLSRGSDAERSAPTSRGHLRLVED